MSKTLQKEILTETYEDMRLLIKGIVAGFWKLNGGDFEDLMSQANLIFIEAIDKYDPSEAELSTWLTIKITNELRNYVKDNSDFVRRNYERIYLSHKSINDENFTEPRPTLNTNFSVVEFLDKLSSDAHVVVWLFLTTPREILDTILNEKIRANRVAACIRNRLKNRLRQMGWSMSRVRLAFDELKIIR